LGGGVIEKKRGTLKSSTRDLVHMTGEGVASKPGDRETLREYATFGTVKGRGLE